jgi:signal transduction histidine kinase
MIPKHSYVHRFLPTALAWGVALGLALGATAFLERRNLVHELSTQSAILHRLASQRADQHDAHLTSLVAVFVAGGVQRTDLFLDVAATIIRFYPRIASVHVVPFDPERQGISTAPMSAEDAELARWLGQQSSGEIQIRQIPAQPDHYMLVKRAPNTDAAEHSLALVISATALIATDDPLWQRASATRRLLTPQGGVLTGGALAGDVVLTKSLGSKSQPLVLETALRISLADLLPARTVALIAALVTALFAVGAVLIGQWKRRKEAERISVLSAQEARLAHASRVNAMGEMASGMAHELAQPLTAILSQAQAGRHLARRGDVAKLGSVLDDTVLQAQRAADILDRLRRWSKPNRAEARPCSLNEAARNVEQFLAREASEKGARVTLTLADDPVTINADPVALEQIIFNLMRNALEASDAANVTVTTRLQGGLATLEVRDSGPGVPEALKPRIFEPFVTGKTDGTGLGLALSHRLVEEMDGEIVLLPDADQTTFRVTFPQVTPDAPR